MFELLDVVPALRFLEGCCVAAPEVVAEEVEPAAPAPFCCCCSLADEGGFEPSDEGSGLRVEDALGRGGPSLDVVGAFAFALAVAGLVFLRSASPFFSATESKSVMSRSLSSA